MGHVERETYDPPGCRYNPYEEPVLDAVSPLPCNLHLAYEKQLGLQSPPPPPPFHHSTPHPHTHQAYEERLGLQSRNSRELNSLLQRKVRVDVWSGCVREGMGERAGVTVPIHFNPTHFTTNHAGVMEQGGRETLNTNPLNLNPSPLMHFTTQASWSEADVSHFAQLCQEEHRLQNQVCGGVIGSGTMLAP